MKDHLERLLGESRQLPYVHLLASFFVAVLAGLLAVAALTGGSEPARSGGNTSKAGGANGSTGGSPESFDPRQQLTVMPVRIARRADWDRARRLVTAQRVGGVLLEGETPAGGDAAVGREVQRLRDAARSEARGFLVVAAVEGLYEQTDSCENVFAGAQDAVVRAIRGETRALVSGLRAIGANALLAYSLKDPGVGCSGGTGVDADVFRALQAKGIVLIARGARVRDGAATPFEDRYLPFYRAGQLHAVTSSSAPRVQPGTPTWRNRAAIGLMHRQAPKLVVGTPDLAVLRGGDLARNVRTALRAGSDLPLFSAPAAGSASGVDAVRAWWGRHRSRLEASCRRIMELKRVVLDAGPGASACSRAPSGA